MVCMVRMIMYGNVLESNVRYGMYGMCGMYGNVW